MGDVGWQSSDEAVATVAADTDGQSAIVTARAEGFVTITATAGLFTATATVEVFAQPFTPGNADKYRVDILAAKMDVNRAQTGTLVPIAISKAAAAQAASAAPMAAAAPFANSSRVIAAVALTGANAGMFTAEPVSDRYILVQATGAAAKKAYKDIRVKLTFTDGAEITSENTIQLTVKESWPKITLKADALNAFYPKATGAVTGTSSDGAAVTVQAVSVASGSSVTVGAGNALVPVKKGNTKLSVTVELEGYKQAYKNGSVGTVTAKVANTAPKLKLSPATVTLGGTLNARVSILSGDSKKALADYGPIESVTLGGSPAALATPTDLIVPAGTTAGKANVVVKFADAGSVTLKLTVKTVAPDKAKISSKTKSLTVHKDHVGTIAAVEILPSIANLDLTGLAVANLPAGLTARQEPGTNLLTFSADGSQAATAKKGVKLNVSAPGVKKPVSITLKVTDKPASFKVSLKGKLSVVDAASSVAATVKLANTTATLTDITLTGAEAGKFEAFGVSGLTFKIRRADGQLVVPGVKYALGVTAGLSNGQSLQLAKPVSITPAQPAGKGSQSKKAVTLYTGALKDGAEIRLGLSAPAGARLSYAQINAASVKKNDFFELVRNGENSWTVRFKAGFDPAAQVNGKGKSTLKASYTVKLELWADGTYNGLDANGKPIALTNAKGKAKTKPVTVKLKIDLK
jgi:hypothetical protein